MMVPNPDYVVWRVRDQHVHTYLVTSLSREVLAGVASNTTAVDMWSAISKTVTSQSHSHILHLRASCLLRLIFCPCTDMPMKWQPSESLSMMMTLYHIF
jgi:hypothetical protein